MYLTSGSIPHSQQECHGRLPAHPHPLPYTRHLILHVSHPERGVDQGEDHWHQHTQQEGDHAANLVNKKVSDQKSRHHHHHWMILLDFLKFVLSGRKVVEKTKHGCHGEKAKDHLTGEVCLEWQTGSREDQTWLSW